MLAVIIVKARDRPGLLRDAANVLKSVDSNIIANVGYAVDGKARLLFIVESGLEPPRLADVIEENLRDDVEEVTAGEPGPEVADALAEMVAEKPVLLSVLESYLAPSDLLGVLLRLPEDERKNLYRLLSIEGLAAILSEADESTVREIAEAVGPKWLARALEAMDPDEVADVLQALDSRMRREVLAELPERLRDQASRLLAYPPESAGGIMTTSVPVLRADSTVQDALASLRSTEYDVRDVIVVVDDKGRLVGLVPVSDLFLSKPEERLGRIAQKPRVSVSPLTDREEAAKLMMKYYVNRLPVVDDKGSFLGIVTVEDVAHTLAEEAAEDIAKLGGVVGGIKPSERYMTSRTLDLIRSRLPWLLVIYAIESVTANVLKSYEHVIEKAALITAFIPLIMGTGGNVGSQASSLVLRALALGEVSESSRYDVLRIILKEVKTSSMMALVMASIGFAFALAVSESVKVALSVSLTLAAVTVAADLIGALLPVIARKLGVDPAALSTPLLSTLIDVSVAFIYMAIATRIVLGHG